MIIGLTGKKGVGKDTVADYFIREYGFVRVAFADALKISVARLFGITLEQIERFKNEQYVTVSLGLDVDDGYQIPAAVMSFRKFLQRYGTEAHRDVFGDSFWTDCAVDRIQELNRDGWNVVVTDVRFDNEAELIRSLEGTLVGVRRPQVETDADLHASEQTPDPDLELWNEGTILDLEDRAQNMLGLLNFLVNT